MLKHDRNLWYITAETLLLDVTLHSGLGYITFSPAFGVFMKEDDSSHDSLLLYCTSSRMFGFWWQEYILNTQTSRGHFFSLSTFISLLPLSQNQSLYKISHSPLPHFFCLAELLPSLVAQQLAVLQVAQPTMEIQSLSAQRVRGAEAVSSSLSKHFWSFRAKRVGESWEK